MLLRPSDEHTALIGGDPAISEQSRQINNLLTTGVVAEVDYTNLKIRVNTLFDEQGQALVTTGWIPWAVARSGDDVTWWPPSVGENVSLVSPSGDLCNAFATMANYSTDSPVPKDDRRSTLHRTVYHDKAVMEYDQETHTATVDLSKVEEDTTIILRATIIRLN